MMGTKEGHQIQKLAGKPVQIAIFASGAGSNAQKIIDHFRNSVIAQVSLIVCNKPGAGVTNIAAKENIPLLLIGRNQFDENGYLESLRSHKIDFIVLAGFLWKIPVPLIKAYPGKIVNIHPALLPGYGGKGMYGDKVHDAVIKAGVAKSGITIHLVDEIYDNGEIVFQKECPVESSDTPLSLATKIHSLEHTWYPQIIEKLVKMQIQR